jgi:hypothetical protein
MARRNRTPSLALTEAGGLDVAVCESARVNRDRRYDGLFSPAFAQQGSTAGPFVLYEQPRRTT